MREQILEGMRQGTPKTGPVSVHIDVTNGCNAACITCWDHSPLLKNPRSNDWKRRRLSRDRFFQIVDELDAMGSVKDVILSGMGDPLTHPHIYEMIGAVKERGWKLTVLSNLLAADIDKLAVSGVDSLLVGVQGATPDSYTAFHPGWTEKHFFTLCRYLRVLQQSGVRTKHVQVINRDTAPEVVDMVDFAKLFSASRVNYKLASLYDGTEGCSITEEQRDWLLNEGIVLAREKAQRMGVHTNLDLFEQQLRAAQQNIRHSTDMGAVGCFMGYVYTRITVDQDVLYCCNTKVKVGSLREHRFSDLWWGKRWQKLRDHLRSGLFFSGCEVCGKYEQNRKWMERYGRPLHEALSNH
ncbi:MAG: radical SAM protein [Myxococcota bacterium]|nr:radical SAM protein [Myxococcota bacterium]